MYAPMGGALPPTVTTYTNEQWRWNTVNNGGFVSNSVMNDALRTRLRIMCRKASGFESRHPHHLDQTPNNGRWVSITRAVTTQNMLEYSTTGVAGASAQA